MRLLLWKDYRLSRVILATGVLLAVGPYLFAGGYMRLDAGWELSAFLSQFTLALLAGNIIACERADQSAEFLAFQGASRVMVVMSKALLCLIVFVTINAMMVASREAIILLTPDPYAQRPPRWYMASLQFGAAATGLAFWGCCWLLSSFLERPATAVLLGMPVPALVAFALNQHDWNQLPGQYWCLYGGTCAAIGATCFLSGTYYYVRRREP